MTYCDHPWATQDDIGRPYCQACGKPWGQVRKEEAMNEVKKLLAEIERLQDAKRAALKLADERAIEANGLRVRIELLENALKAIKRATINGDVCDDVAWFDQIETLHDFCDRILGGC